MDDVDAPSSEDPADPEDGAVGRSRRRPADVVAAVRGIEPGLAIVLLLTLSTGAVDAVSFFSLDHVFTANMSGNIALLGVGAATSFGDVVGNVFAFAGFVVGSVLVARFLRPRRGPALRVARDALVLELALLLVVAAVLAAVDVRADDAWRYGVCFVLAAAMGVQTGVARTLAVADVNTTVATMTLHDLAAASRVAGGDSTRWGRRATVVAALFVGAAIGVALDGVVRWGGLAFTCLLVLVVVMATSAVVVEREAATV